MSKKAEKSGKIITGKKEELRKKQLQTLTSSVQQQYPKIFTQFLLNQRLLIADIKTRKITAQLIFTSKNQPLLFTVDQIYLPTLQVIRTFPDLLPHITVDAGAVKFMINGADLFRPGITTFDAFKKNDFIIIINEQGSALAIGKALIHSNEMPDTGKVTKAIHHLQDEIWNFSGK